METIDWFIVYGIGWAIWTVVMFEGKSPIWNDWLSSAVVGLIWPIHFPAMIIKRTLR